MRERRAIIVGEPVGSKWKRVTRHLPGGRVVPGMAKSDSAMMWMERAIGSLSQTDWGTPWTGPVFLQVDIYRSRPKNMIWKSKPMPVAWCRTKPDRTNVLKLAEDALKGLWWLDDNQVVDGPERKLYVPGPGFGDTRPRVELYAYEITDPPVVVGATPQLDSEQSQLFIVSTEGT